VTANATPTHLWYTVWRFPSGPHVRSLISAIRQVDVDGYIFPGSHALATNGTAIFDHGASQNYLPTPIAAAVNAAFEPPAWISSDDGAYYVKCAAVPPPFAVVLGGTRFVVAAADMIYPVGSVVNGTRVCQSNIQDGGPANPGHEGSTIFSL
jgi:hypothetical protein